MRISPSVANWVSESARIGKNVKIWHFAYIGNETTNDPYPTSPKMSGVVFSDGDCRRWGVDYGRCRHRKQCCGCHGIVVTKDVPADMVVMGNPARVRYSRSDYNKKQQAWNS